MGGRGGEAGGGGRGKAGGGKGRKGGGVGREKRGGRDGESATRITRDGSAGSGGECWVEDQEEMLTVIERGATLSWTRSSLCEVLERHVGEREGPKLEGAAIVVSGGRGLGSAEAYEPLVEELAKLLGGASGASRAIVDAGWVPYSKQVGQTGKTVKPKVYLALGISGATQHMVGMKGSDNIIAINKDGEAPIFSVADLGIVGDVHKVVPKLIEALKARG